MPNTSIRNRTSALVVALSVSLLPLGLAACGGSSSTSTNASTSTSTTTSASAGASGRNAGRFAALRSCLQKEGITLPQRPAGAKRTPGTRPGGGGFLGGGAGRTPQLPKGVTRAQLQNAMRKCGGGAFAGGARANNPAFQQSLVKFATCMRQNGVKLPAPSTSGGPVFNTKGLNTHSKTFTTAETKCQSLIRGSFRRGGAAPGGGR